MRWTRAWVLCLALGGCGTGRESSPADPPAVVVTLSDAWAEPAEGGGSGSRVGMRIVNRARRPERILSVSTSRARVSRMMEPVRPPEGGSGVHELHGGFKLDAGATLDLAPERSHILLEGLTPPLRGGEIFLLQVHCQNAGMLEVAVPVKN